MNTSKKVTILFFLLQIRGIIAELDKFEKPGRILNAQEEKAWKKLPKRDELLGEESELLAKARGWYEEEDELENRVKGLKPKPKGKQSGGGKTTATSSSSSSGGGGGWVSKGSSTSASATKAKSLALAPAKKKIPSGFGALADSDSDE